MSPNVSWIVLLLLGVATPTVAEDAETRVAEAVRAYRQALETEDRDERLAAFRRAMLGFDRVVREGVENPDLYANLGNAALQAEQLGPAILAYRRALRLDPDHIRARDNLRHARDQLPDWVPRREKGSILDTFFFWHNTLSSRERSSLGAALFALAGLLLAISVRWQLAWPRNLAVLPALGWLALLVSVFLEPDGAEEALVVRDEVVARSADSQRAPSRFPEPLPGGTEVRIIEERDAWTHIRLANGRDAWVDSGSLTRLTP